MDFDADLTFMLSSDFGSPIVFGSVTGHGIVTLATVEDGVKGGDSVILGETRVLIYSRADFPSLVGGASPSSITISSGPHAGTYKVNAIHHEDDGRKARAFLRSA